MIKLINILREITVYKPQTYFFIQNEIDKKQFETLAKKNNWIYYTGDMAYDDVIKIGEEYKLILDKNGYYIVYPTK
jgi:hypothetical protein